MTEHCDPFAAPDQRGMGISLRRIDRRLERQNRRLLANLMSWGEILDALGWNVALRLPGREPVFLSARARNWASEQPEPPTRWEEIADCLADAPPSRQLARSNRVRVWADAGAELQDNGVEGIFRALTNREAEVLGWLREGKTGPEIAIILGCARRTVEGHVARLYRKIGVHHRAQLFFQIDPAVR